MKSLTKALVVAAMLPGVPGAAMAQTQGVSDDKVVLGTHSDLSGPLAIGGVPSTTAAQIRFDIANAAGGVHGRQIVVEVEDTQYQVPLAVRAANKLISRDKVMVLFNSLGTQQGLAVMPIADKANVPSLFPLTAAAAMADPFHDLHITHLVSYADQARGAIRFLNGEGFEKICMQTHSTEYGEENRLGAEKIIAELGMEMVYFGGHKPTESEFSGVATAMKNAGCDAVYLGATIKDSIAIYITLRQLGYTGPVVSNMLPFLTQVAAAGGGAMEGFYVVTPWVQVDDWAANPERKVFYDEYMKRQGEAPTVYAMNGYIAADLMVTALENAGRDLTVDSLIAGVEQIASYSDPFGGPEMSFGPDKHFGADSLKLYQVQGGAWALVNADLPFRGTGAGN